MIRWLAMAVLALAAPAQAQAQAQNGEAAIRSIVRGIYAGYQGKGDARVKAPRATAQLAAVEKQCGATGRLLDKQESDASYGYCANDYDRFCQCQDWQGIDFAAMKVDVAVVGASANATLRFSGGEGPDLRLMFRRDAKGWALDDIWEFNRLESDDGTPGEASYRTRLIGEIAEMRTTLKLPAWSPPQR